MPREPSVSRERMPREPTVFRGRMPREPTVFRGRMPREPTVFGGNERREQPPVEFAPPPVEIVAGGNPKSRWLLLRKSMDTKYLIQGRTKYCI